MRLRAGWKYLNKDYSQVNSHPDTVLPNDTVYSYPFADREYFQEKYIEKNNLLQMGVVEDLSLGHHFLASLGWSNTLWGASENALTFTLAYSSGFEPSQRNLGLLSMDSKGFIRDGKIHDGNLRMQGDLFFFQSRHSSLHFFGDIEVGSADHQIAFGGDNGLRGYPLKM